MSPRSEPSLRGPLRHVRRRARPDRGTGQPRRWPERAQGLLRRASARTSAPRHRGEEPTDDAGRSRRRPPTARPAGPSSGPAAWSQPQATSTPSEQLRDRRASRPPTSSTAPPSRSCASSELGLVYRAYQDELAPARRARLRRADRRRHAGSSSAGRTSSAAGSASTATSSSTSSRTRTSPRSSSIELLGRTPDRPDNVMVVGDDDQSIYRFRGASFAAFAEFDRALLGPPTHDPTPRARSAARLRIEQNFRSVRARPRRRQPPDRPATSDPLRARQAADHDARPGGVPVELITCASPEDEAVAIVDAIQAARSRTGDGPPAWSTSPSCTASTSTARRSSPGCATRTSRTRSSAACRCSTRPRSATSSRASGRSRTRTTTSPSSG